MPHFMIVLIPYINLLNVSWNIKCLSFEEYDEAFNLPHFKTQKEGVSFILIQFRPTSSVIFDTRVVQNVLSLIGFLSFIPGIF